MIHILSDLLDDEQIAQVLHLLDEPSITPGPWVDGRETAGPAAQRVKNNQQVAQNWPALPEMQNIVQAALHKHAEFKAAAIPSRVAQPVIARYLPGMSYGEHCDNPVMAWGGTLFSGGGPVRTDLALTIFLSDPDSYDGGELVMGPEAGVAVHGEGAEARFAGKLPKGSGVLYPAGTLHRVAPVNVGERLVIVTWIQSMVRDESRRLILADLTRLLEAVRTHAQGTVWEASTLARVRGALYREWVEV